jgi:hypothetical protein
MGHRGEILAAMIGVEKQPEMFDTRGTSDMWSIRKSLNGGFLSHGGTPILVPSFKWPLDHGFHGSCIATCNIGLENNTK